MQDKDLAFDEGYASAFSLIFQGKSFYQGINFELRTCSIQDLARHELWVRASIWDFYDGNYDSNSQIKYGGRPDMGDNNGKYKGELCVDDTQEYMHADELAEMPCTYQ